MKLSPPTLEDRKLAVDRACNCPHFCAARREWPHLPPIRFWCWPIVPTVQCGTCPNLVHPERRGAAIDSIRKRVKDQKKCKRRAKCMED